MHPAFRRLYYYAKPYIPENVRVRVRRVQAKRIVKNSSDVWPISESAGRKPAEWPGWPGGKRFALVLTHDVESQLGVDRCRSVMELELSFGVRSSFNFIPEGGYQTPKELRDELVRNGFEIGVHDLRHDGKLYASRSAFRQNAAKINEYLRDWGAVGFRSGFMHHNFEWLHDLEVLYDASSFDTDPLEPQPDAVDTIFPFWVPNERGGGYVELPYTLPQDSTLYRLLQEQTIDVWKRKLKWIAQHGGMALLNLHPDYAEFGNMGRRGQYPHCAYIDFLEHVKAKYSGVYWQPLPKQVAEFYRQTRTSQSAIVHGAETA
jgi:peptidoglycan/xylan/chitin deacetylase (PgdA/CDA1 family)